MECRPRKRRWDVAKTIGIIAGGWLFVGGSALFMPGQNSNAGAWLFSWGCALYTIIRGHDVIELLTSGGGGVRCLDLTVALLYLIGLLMFLVASICFMDNVALLDVGGLLFILGSLFFVLGASVNVFQASELRAKKAWKVTLLAYCTATSYAIGSTLFLCGRLVYLLMALNPGADTLKLMRSLSIQCIAGSTFFVIGGVLNYIRVVLSLSEDDDVDAGAEQHQSGKEPISNGRVVPPRAARPCVGDLEDRPVLDLINEIYVPTPDRGDEDDKEHDARGWFLAWMRPKRAQHTTDYYLPQRSNVSLTTSNSEEPSVNFITASPAPQN